MWDTLQAWWLIAALVIAPAGILGWMLWTSAGELGWTKTLTDAAALLGVCVLVIGVGLLGARLLT